MGASVLEQPLTMNPILSKILALADATPRQSVAVIAAAVSRSPGHVYAVLRAHRPERPRKVHKTRSDKPHRIAVMHLANVHPDDIAERLGVSRTYVYRHLPRDRSGAILPPCPVPAAR
jgi:hypothetical protein